MTNKVLNLVVILLSAFGSSAQNDWENENIIAINKETVRSTVFYNDNATNIKKLNGVWDFNFVDSPDKL